MIFKSSRTDYYRAEECWASISTAPKDGARVELWTPYNKKVVIGRNSCENIWLMDTGGTISNETAIKEGWQWKPLPDPPKPKKVDVVGLPGMFPKLCRTSADGWAPSGPNAYDVPSWLHLCREFIKADEEGLL